MSFPWFALQVRYHYENVVTAHLAGKGFEWFSPLYKRRRRWSDRFKEMDEPLFPGYVFCRLNPLDRLPVLTIPGVALIAGMGKTPVPIDETEIAAIQAAVKAGLSNQPWRYMQIGERVKIEQGPLSGVEGILLGFKGGHRLLLSITLLQRSIAVQIDDSWVKPALRYPRAFADSAVETPAVT
jgi:transcription antitermination factor NusG